jgi:hypothetical protein
MGICAPCRNGNANAVFSLGKMWRRRSRRIALFSVARARKRRDSHRGQVDDRFELVAIDLYGRDQREDCVQVVVALVVTPEGLPLAGEMFPGNTADKTTLKNMLKLIQLRNLGLFSKPELSEKGAANFRATGSLFILPASQSPQFGTR